MAAPHPIGLVVTDDLRRNRLTVFFRLLLAIPQSIWLALWGIVVYLAVFVAGLCALVTGRVPAGLHAFIAGYLRAFGHLQAYVFLLADPWPPFSGDHAYPVDVHVDGPQPQNRLTVFFRALLAIPAFVLAYVFRLVNQVIALLGWFYAVVMGRMPNGMRDLGVWLMRYELQTYAYAMLLTSRYPSLEGAPQSAAVPTT